MENVRKHVDVRLIHKWEGRYSGESLIARPNFHSSAIFDENLVAIQLKRTEVHIGKPIYVGMSILDISKTHMYDFHYGFMKEQLGDSCTLIYTDTDSFVYNIEGVNIYDFMKNNLDKFDTSDYPENNPFGIPRVNKKKLGYFKDECNSAIMQKFIVLRAKMYAALILEKDPIKKAKGIKSCVVRNSLGFNDYEECINNMVIKKIEQKTIRSRLHAVHTEKQKKIGLSPFDDKRYLVPNSTNTLPWGHYDIPEEAYDVGNKGVMAGLNRSSDDVMEDDVVLDDGIMLGPDEIHAGSNRSNDDVMDVESGPDEIPGTPPTTRKRRVYMPSGSAASFIPLIDLDDDEPPQKHRRIATKKGRHIEQGKHQIYQIASI